MDLDPPLIHDSLSPPKSTTQTASWWVHPSLQGSWSWQTEQQTDHTTSLTTGHTDVRRTAVQSKNNGLIAASIFWQTQVSSWCFLHGQTHLLTRTKGISNHSLDLIHSSSTNQLLQQCMLPPFISSPMSVPMTLTITILHYSPIYLNSLLL